MLPPSAWRQSAYQIWYQKGRAGIRPSKFLSWRLQKLRQLCDVGRYSSRLVERECLAYRGIASHQIRNLRKLNRETEWIAANTHRVSCQTWDSLVTLGFVEERHAAFAI